MEEHGGMGVPEWIVAGNKVRLRCRIASVEDVVNVIRGEDVREWNISHAYQADD